MYEKFKEINQPAKYEYVKLFLVKNTVNILVQIALLGYIFTYRKSYVVGYIQQKIRGHILEKIREYILYKTISYLSRFILKQNSIFSL